MLSVRGPRGALVPVTSFGPWAVALSLFSESVALPGFSRLGSVHPGAEVGVERSWTAPDRRVALASGLRARGYSHAGLHDAGLVTTDLAVRPRLDRVFADLALGVGAMASRSDLARFEAERPHAARGRWDLDAAVTLGLGAGVAVSDRFDLFARWEALAELPFGLQGNPVLPHRQVHLGLRARLGARP